MEYRVVSEMVECYVIVIIIIILIVIVIHLFL